MKSSLFFLPLVFVLCEVSANFNPEDLEGLFRLRAGSDSPDSRCGDLLRFSSSGTQVPANAISVDDQQCTGGGLTLLKNPSQGDSGFIRFFALNREAGDFYAASPSARIACNSSAFGADSVFVFVRPNRDLFITWDDVAGFQTPLELVIGASYTFRAGVSYVILNNRCLFTREAAQQVAIEERSSCFPAGASIEKEDGTRIPVQRLRVGDSVRVGASQFSQVMGWTHFDAHARGHRYLRIDAGLRKPLTLTPSHYVYANGRAIPARLLRVGDVMSTGEGEGVRVVDVTEVSGIGLYNPQTLHGDIVVDGVLVSTYTDSLNDAVAHALLAPVRVGFKVGLRMGLLTVAELGSIVQGIAAGF